MRLLNKEDSQVSSSLSNGVFALSTGGSQEFLSQGVLLNNELSVQCEDGRSLSAEEEYCMPECCAPGVDIYSCLFCGEDGKNHRYNENAICKYVDSRKFSESKTISSLKQKVHLFTFILGSSYYRVKHSITSNTKTL